MVRIIAWIIRFVQQMKNKVKMKKVTEIRIPELPGTLSDEEIKIAEKYFFRAATRGEAFHAGKEISKVLPGKGWNFGIQRANLEPK